MAGGSDHDVICIETKKICDFCFQEDRIERQFKWHHDWDGGQHHDWDGGHHDGSGHDGIGHDGSGHRGIGHDGSGHHDRHSWKSWCEKADVHCHIDRDNICCTEVDRKEIDCEKCLWKVTVRIEVPLVIWVDGKCVKKSVIFLKQAIISAPHGTDVECDVSGHCSCVLDWETKCLICVLDLCVVIKSFTTVQVLVPTLGFCSPKKCHGLLHCPPVPPKCCDKADKRDGKDHDCCCH
jgi:hypothetical protein